MIKFHYKRIMHSGIIPEQVLNNVYLKLETVC